MLYYIKLCLKKRRQKNQRKLKPKILQIEKEDRDREVN